MLIKRMDWMRFTEEDFKLLNKEKKAGCYGYISVLAANQKWFAVCIGYNVKSMNAYKREGISLSVYPYNPETMKLGDLIMEIADIGPASSYDLFQTKVRKAITRHLWKEMLDPRRKQKKVILNTNPKFLQRS